MREMERRFLSVPDVGDQTGHEIDSKVDRAPVARGFNLKTADSDKHSRMTNESDTDTSEYESAGGDHRFQHSET